jgi:hypothetical protein
VYYIQLEQTRRVKGRKYLKDYSHENKNIYEVLKRRTLAIQMLENKKDPFFLWLERYVNESGF